MREMKDSGIEWIGEIPATWSRIKIKNVFHIIGGCGFKEAFQGEDRGDLPFLKASDITGDSKYVATAANYVMYDLAIREHYNIVPPNSILMAKIGEALKKNHRKINTVECIVDNNCQALALVDAKNTDISFAYYLMSCIDMVWFDNGGTIPCVNNRAFRDSFIYLPCVIEQHDIADCLDRKCAEIDTLTSDIETQIETLEQYKRSVVFHAVAHGLDKNEMTETDSDIWSEIPHGWKLVDIKYLFEIVKRISGKEGFDILSVTQRGIKVKDISSNEGQIANDYSGYQFVYPTDYVMNHMDLLTGWVDCSTQFGVTSPDYRVFRLRDKISNDIIYYKYLMQCCYMCRIFYSLGQGVSTLGRWRLQTSVFMNFKIPVPPLQEQKEIASFLDHKIPEIDEVIDEKQNQLKALAEYKKSLIYEYVTGKKEVPSVNETSG